ncbi:MAG: hypothetical protein V4629_04150 [Pseudomonadota bacterium]
MTERKDAHVTLLPPQDVSLSKTYEASLVNQWPTMPCLVDFKMSQVIVPGITLINEDMCHFDLVIEDGELWLAARDVSVVRLNGELIVSARLYVGDTIEVAEQSWIVEGGEAWHRIQNSEILENLLHVEEMLSDPSMSISEKHENRAEWLNHHELAEELEHFRKRLNRWLSWQALSSPTNKILESSNTHNSEKSKEFQQSFSMQPVPIPESIYLKPSTLAQLVDEVHQAAQNDIFLDCADSVVKTSLLRSEQKSDFISSVFYNKKTNTVLKISVGCFIAALTFWFLFTLS